MHETWSVGESASLVTMIAESAFLTSSPLSSRLRGAELCNDVPRLTSRAFDQKRRTRLPRLTLLAASLSP